MEYLIISVPLEKENKTFKSVHKKFVTKNKPCQVVKFPVPPEFRVGTLNVLMDLPTKLQDLEIHCDSVIHELISYMGKIKKGEQSELLDNFPMNNEFLDKLILQYNWNRAKFFPKDSLENLYSTLSNKIENISEIFKTRSQTYNQVIQNVEKIQRQQSDESLLTRNLSSIVPKEALVLDSEYMVTLLVVVAKTHFKKWSSSYYNMSQFVVPNSSNMIFQDENHGLFTVTLFKMFSDEFKAKAVENKFSVRDFVYDEKEYEKQRKENEKLLVAQKKRLLGNLKWLTTSIQETVTCLLHILEFL